MERDDRLRPVEPITLDDVFPERHALRKRINVLKLECAKDMARIKHAGPPEPLIPTNFWCVTAIASVTMMVVMYLARNG